MSTSVILLGLVALFVLVVFAKSVRIVPQSKAGVVERLGRFHRELAAGLTVVVPFVDKVRPLIDLREQVVTFPPQSVITSDNVVVNIDTVIYYQVTDSQALMYGVAQPVQAIEQLTTTSLRNIVGSLDLEEALTSRDTINGRLRSVLDEATGKWGIRVNRVELRAIDPPHSIQEAMEKQMRAERDKRAAVLTAQGQKEASILTAQGQKEAAILSSQGEREAQIQLAEGERQAQILHAEGDRQARILTAQGEAEANLSVFASLHEGQMDPQIISYLYMQMLPKLADGQANKLFVIPGEFTQAMSAMAEQFTPSKAPTHDRRTSDGHDADDAQVRPLQEDPPVFDKAPPAYESAPPVYDPLGEHPKEPEHRDDRALPARGELPPSPDGPRNDLSRRPTRPAMSPPHQKPEDGTIGPDASDR